MCVRPEEADLRDREWPRSGPGARQRAGGGSMRIIAKRRSIISHFSKAGFRTAAGYELPPLGGWPRRGAARAGMQDGSDSWKDCFCRHETAIERSFMIGEYASKLAWWLAFFPPERFLIIRSAQLRDPGGSVQVGRCPGLKGLQCNTRHARHSLYPPPLFTLTCPCKDAIPADISSLKVR